MARIRTIKPSLWTDADFVECSSNARLLFVAALNFASDYGVLPDKPVELKMQCFPGDNVDVGPLVQELIDHRLWIRRTAPDGAKVLVIRTFQEHQKVDKPNDGKWGNPNAWPEFVDLSTNDPGEVDDHSPPEGKGREGKTSTSPPATDPAFDAFWQCYPRKIDKRTAETKFASAVKAHGTETVMAGLERWCSYWRADRTEDKHIPHPPVWLNKERFLADPPKSRNEQRPPAVSHTGVLMAPGAQF